MHKLVVLVRRRIDVSHDELVARWQDAHMPAVIKHVQPDHYRVTFFDAQDNTHYDGMAVLWFEESLALEGVDAVVKGEGQKPMLDLLAAWEAGEEARGIPGVVAGR